MNKVTGSLHNHSIFCDGKNTPREMIEAAILAGFTDFGMSSHGNATFDPNFTVKDEQAYFAQMCALKAEYAQRIRFYAGIERDYLCAAPDIPYDYVVGSVHHIKNGERYYAVDGTPEELAALRDQVFGGDIKPLVRKYYSQVVDNVVQNKPTVVGHFDLVGKNNADFRFFDEDAKWYTDIALEALDAVLECGRVIEMNTKGIRKRGLAYPREFLLKRILEKKGRITLSADAHSTSEITFGFEDSLKKLSGLGYKNISVWRDSDFTEVNVNSLL